MSEKQKHEQVLRLVGHFWEKLNSENILLSDILEDIIKLKNIKEQSIFMIGVFSKDEITIYSAREIVVQKRIESEKVDGQEMRTQFRRMCEEGQEGYEYCRCIGGRMDDRGQFYYSIYYYCRMPNTVNVINPIYLKQVERVYYNTLSGKLAEYLGAGEAGGKLGNEFFPKEICTIVKRDAQLLFEKYMKSVFALDLQVLNELSGSYYEGKPCKCGLAFCLGKKRKLQGVEFTQPVPFAMKNIRKIRKILAMGGAEHCVVVYFNKKNGWAIQGVVGKKSVEKKSVMVYVSGHMIWNMKLFDKSAVCYNCGSYEIKDDFFGEDEFKRKFKNVYSLDPCEKMLEVFRSAVQQKSGTIVIIFDSNAIEEEMRNILQDSAVIQTKTEYLEKDFISGKDSGSGVTAIDGALMVDENGKCYGIGAMLYSKKPIKGTPERGARYNSTLRYINGWKEADIRVMGIVVSEDGSVDIIINEK